MRLVLPPLAVVALVLVGCSSPAVKLVPEAAAEVHAGPVASPVGVGASVKAPTLELGSGAVAAPPAASWPASASPKPAPAQADPAPAPSGPATSLLPSDVHPPGLLPAAVSESDPCAGGVCHVPEAAPPRPTPAPGESGGVPTGALIAGGATLALIAALAWLGSK